MRIQPANSTNFNGRFIYDDNLTINQLKNFRIALKNFDIYSKDYNLRIFNDLSMDKMSIQGKHYVCVTAESQDRKKQLDILINPYEQRKLKLIKQRVSEASDSYEKKYKSFWGKLKNIFSVK